MEEALQEARLAFEKGEVPVGAVIVQDGVIIGRGHNLVESLQDPTAHAERLSISEASSNLSNWRLIGATIYSTLEPCPMCFGALVLSRVARLVYGAPDFRHGALGGWLNLASHPHPIHNFEVKGGVLEKESAFLLRSFFQARRSR